MYEIKELTGTEIECAKKLYMSHNRLQRGAFQRCETDIEDWINAGLVFVGAFDSDELVAFMTYRLLTQLPISRVGNIHIKTGHKETYYFGNNDHPISKILDYILELAESREYYTWLYSRANLPIYAKLTERKQDLLRSCKYGYDNERQQYRYDTYVDEIVQPYSISKYDSYNKMFSLGRYEQEIVIFKCCLKSEYRKWQALT